MMNDSTVTITGNLVSDAVTRITARGDQMTTFRVASTATRYDRAEARWVDGDTSYWNVTTWRRAAQNAAVSLAKGLPVVVHGRLRQRTAERPVPGSEGSSVTVTYTDIDALAFGLDLTRCRARFERAPTGPQTGTQLGPQHDVESGPPPDAQHGPRTSEVRNDDPDPDGLRPATTDDKDGVEVARATAA